MIKNYYIDSVAFYKHLAFENQKLPCNLFTCILKLTA